MKANLVAIVTGGASGLGWAVVNRLVLKGIAVALIDISKDVGESQAKSLQAAGVEARFFQADVTQQQQATDVVAEIIKEWGRVDILVNAAGIIRRTPAALVSNQELHNVLDVNLCGTVYMCQAVHPYMKQSGGGSIVTFASMLAHYGSENLLSYAASKGGIVQITKCLAVEWAKDNIRVNAVSPGYIETPLASGATKDPVFRERILSKTPQRRFGTPDEVAAVIDFLSSMEASFITGVVLPIDGGLLAGDPSLYSPATLIK